ncbi:dna repair transcription protein [Rutstroemia sp. NJR-2017a WRK4]|nr:dna repair transcription protein [Rutstroemia sp. NJR-2017a WRK4]
MASGVVEFMAAETEADKSAAVERMVANPQVITGIITDLGPYIDGEASMVDCQKGLEFLLLVLQRVDPEQISRHDLSILVEYLAKRISEAGDVQIYRAGLQEVAKSLMTLSQMTKKFLKPHATLISEAVFELPEKMTLRDFPIATRLSLLELLQCLLDLYLPALKRSMGPKFVDGVVSMASLEKSPSCLAILFKVFEKLGLEWDPSPSECEEMFGSFFRYFPITPSSATNLPANDLKFLLQNCFKSNNNYAELAFDAILEKLDSDVSANVKNDVFDALCGCIETYSIPVVSRYSLKIWDSLKWEIWNGENEDFVNRALVTVGAIAKSLGKQRVDWNDPSNECSKFIGHVAKECNEILHDDSKKRFILRSGRILSKLVMSSPYGSTLVTRICLPGLITLSQALTTLSEKTRFIELMNLILEAHFECGKLEYMVLQQDLQPEDVEYRSRCLAAMDDSFGNFREGLVEIYFGSMSDASSDVPIRKLTIKGLTFLARMITFSNQEPLLSEFERGTVLSKLNETALDFNQAVELREVSVSCLGSISVEDPQAFIQFTLSNFMSMFPDALDFKAGAESGLSRAIWLLDSLIDIACTSTCKAELPKPIPNVKTHWKFRLFDAMQAELIEKLVESISKHSNQQPYQMAVLAGIYRALETFDKALLYDESLGNKWESPDPTFHPYAWIVTNLFRRCIGLFQHQEGPLKPSWYVGINDVVDGEVLDDAFVTLIGTIATYVLRSHTTSDKNNFLLKANDEHPEEPSRIWTLFNFGAHTRSGLAASQQHLRGGPPRKCSSIILSTALVAGLRKDARERMKIQVHETAKSMILNAIDMETKCSREARTSMLQLMQLLVNKFGADRTKFEDGKYLHDIMIELVTTAPSPRVYQTLAYFSAAALAAYEPCTTQLITLMMERISDPKYGRKIAQSFSILLAPSPVINEANFCTLRPLRFGRLYSLTVDYLVNVWRSSGDREVKESCLIALGSVLRYMPAKNLQDNAAQIFSVVLAGTDVADNSTKEACMNIMIVLMPGNPSLVEEHLDSVINRMTERTHNTYDCPSDATVEGRCKALEVLAILPSIVRTELLIKRRNRVMKELDVALDDCSREVRARADKSKMIWFNLVTIEA